MSAELKRAIAAACERAYRRGFQHGTLADRSEAATVAEWRFRGDQSHAVAPPGFARIGSMQSVERLAMEEPALVRTLEESEAKAKEYAAERAVWARQKAKLGHQKDTLKARAEELERLLTSPGVMSTIEHYGCPWCTGSVEGAIGKIPHRSTCSVFGSSGIAPHPGWRGSQP